MTPRNSLKNNSGQTLIETLVVSATLLAMFSVLGAIVCFGLVHVGVNYLLHEFLVCKITQKGTLDAKQCRNEFQQKARFFLFTAKLTSFESTETLNKQKVRVTLRMPMNRSLTMKKELELY